MPVRAAVFSYFELDDLPDLLRAISEAGFPAATRLHVGTYGVNGEASDLIRTLEGGRYAPMFKATRTDAWERRRLSPEDERLISSSLRGPVPLERRLFSLSTRQRVAWGVEIGRRYRDTIRHARRERIAVDMWQFDEARREFARSRAERELVRGMLQGLTFGRSPLGDREMKGWIWCTREALRLASRPVDGELTALWRQVERAAFRIVGEEYPNFVGDPRRAARTSSDGQRALAGGGPSRRALAGRYVAGMSPGYRLGVGLGGNTAGLSRAEVNRWRASYIAERARLGLAGFGEFAL
ncbi:MAG: hypothetical protein H0W14_11320, partial [Actinobacteria bacterium]|nr:hypothetical protein [Actinomycetota bacterium]